MDINRATVALEKLDLNMAEGYGDKETGGRAEDDNNIDRRGAERGEKEKIDEEPDRDGGPGSHSSVDSSHTSRSAPAEASRGTWGGDASTTTVFASSPGRRVWALGSRYVVKERACPPRDDDDDDDNYEDDDDDGDRNTEADAARLLGERGVDVPVPRVVMSWRDGDRAFAISERLPGRPLMEVWDGLSGEDRHRVARQTSGMVARLRAVKSGTCAALDGGPVRDVNIPLLLRRLPATGGGGGEAARTRTRTRGRRSRRSRSRTGRRGGFGPLGSDDEAWDQMFRPRLDGAGVAAEHRSALRELMPAGGCGPPYVLTHGDLSFGNVLVGDGDGDGDGEGEDEGEGGGYDVSGIVDFEFAAFLPAWWEYAAAHFGSSCRGDDEWREVLRLYLEPHERALDWYLYWAELCRTPRPDDIDIWPEILAKYEREE